ncbi:uncharacterized protein METZ01_LOCUS142024 [marine metagenome]|uniref:Uncharacterized protein n=1 Tax=marine metagenome TaxID=408172 RepID=A0A381ZIV1_9ZZZZ
MGGLPGQGGGLKSGVSQFLISKTFNPDGTPKAGANVTKWGPGQGPKDSLPKSPQTTQKKVGVAKTRKEVLKNVPDQKIIKRGKDYRSRITSRVQTSGVTKRRDVARPNLGSRVAALLKPKTDKKKKEDKLG